MGAAGLSPIVSIGDAELLTVRRVSLRLLPILFLLYILAYLDRANVGIAALQMNRDLKFSSATFGLGAGIFFIGYALCEVPSNLILARVGARRWLARIAISWGVLACGTMLVRTPAQFYAVRFLLGVAEAGLFPGAIYYLSHWFPEHLAYYSVALAFVFWTPTLVRDALHTSDSASAFITGAIALCGAVGYPLAGVVSDRWGDRCALAALGLLLGLVGCVGVAILPHSALRIVPLILITLCSAVYITSFWCLPTKFLAGPSAAAGIALLNAVGSIGGFFGPSIFGFLRSETGGDVAGLSALAALALIGSLMCVRLRRLAVFRAV